jgi:hypothetical protein
VRNTYKILVGKPEGKIDHLDVGIDRKVLLVWYLGKYGGMGWAGFV